MSKHVAIVCGSVRPASNTLKAINVVAPLLRTLGIAVEVLDPARYALSLAGFGVAEERQLFLQSLANACTVLMATPEYDGSYSSVLKLLIENMGYPSVLSGKPIVILGVSTGKIGAIKAIEHLKGVCSHVGGIVLPGALSIAEAGKKFSPDGECTDVLTLRQLEALAQTVFRAVGPS